MEVYRVLQCNTIDRLHNLFMIFSSFLFLKANKNSWQSSSRDVSFESDDPFELSEVDRGITAQRKLKRRGEERRVGDQTPGEWRESIERELFQTRQHLRVKVDETTVMYSCMH